MAAKSDDNFTGIIINLGNPDLSSRNFYYG